MNHNLDRFDPQQICYLERILQARTSKAFPIIHGIPESWADIMDFTDDFWINAITLIDIKLSEPVISMSMVLD